ncbi:MAG: glycosyltransferase family 1 protein, partial [Opitutaceae bacterium]|nr:glycosyltransferase family 1 protein [Cytophagales bacterium]
SGNVKLIIQPEASPILPFDVFELNIPVACFQIDTNLAARQRAKASRPFDITFVFHPGYENLFKKWGVTNTLLVPHAIEKHLFPYFLSEKKYEIGWVGRTDVNNYKLRRQILPILCDRFKMNDPFRQYSQSEMIEVYSQSSIVVNISKDDFLQDANIRCFEAMASGALLITHMPSELSEIGFEEGKHFIGFIDSSDLVDKIEFYLLNNLLADKIAKEAKNLVLNNHTYNARALKIVETLEHLKIQKKTKSEIYRGMFYYFCFRRELNKALYAFKKLPSLHLSYPSEVLLLLKLILSKLIHKERVF